MRTPTRTRTRDSDSDTDTDTDSVSVSDTDTDSDPDPVTDPDLRRADEPPSHGTDDVELSIERSRACDVAPRFGHRERSSYFAGGTQCEIEVLLAIAALAPVAFVEVEADGSSSASDLIRERRVRPLDLANQRRKSSNNGEHTVENPKRPK